MSSSITFWPSWHSSLSTLVKWVSPFFRDVGSIGCYGTELPHCAGAGRHCHLPRLSWVLLPASGRVQYFPFRYNTLLPVDQSEAEQVHIININPIGFPSTSTPGATQKLTFDTPCLCCLTKSCFFLLKTFLPSRLNLQTKGDSGQSSVLLREREKGGGGGEYFWLDNAAFILVDKIQKRIFGYLSAVMVV